MLRPRRRAGLPLRHPAAGVLPYVRHRLAPFPVQLLLVLLMVMMVLMSTSKAFR